MAAGVADDVPFETATEVVDRGRTVPLRRRELLVEGRDGAPLAVVDKAPADGSEARRVLLVHGLRGTRGAFGLPSRSFQCALVEAGHRAWNAELRGSGRSREAGSPPPRSIRELVELDLPALLEAASDGGATRVALVGHSLGGLLCSLVAARMPELVRCVVALAPPHSPGAGQPLVQVASRSFVRLWETGAGRAVLDSRPAGKVIVFGRWLLDRWPLLPRSRSVWPGSMEPEALAELEAAVGGEPAFPGLLADLSRMGAGLEPEGIAVDGDLRRLRAPLLALVGDRDEIAPPEAALTLPDVVTSARCEVRVVGDGEGHVGHADLILGRRAPELVWGAVRAWIEEN